MAFLKKLKAMFGFGDAGNDEELTEMFLPYEAQHRTPYINPFKKEDDNIAMDKNNTTTKSDDTTAETEVAVIDNPEPAGEEIAADNEFDELPDEMYNGVLSIINSTLPTFVRSCLDVDAEKRAIAQALGPHIKNAMQRVKTQMAAETGRQWKQKQAKMEAQVAQAENRAKEAAERVAQVQAKAQAADAQRNAVNERCRTLETRIAELEAEHEQFELENKSLVNKVKVAQVYANDIERYKEEIAELHKQIDQLKAGPDAQAIAAVEAKWSEEVARLQQELATKNADIDSLTKKEEETAKQLAATREELDDALAAVDIVNEVQTMVEKQSAQIKQRDEKIASMREQSNKREAEAARSYNDLNNEHINLKRSYDSLKAETQKLREAIANADKDKEEAVAEMQETLLRTEKEVEDLKRRLAAMTAKVEEAQKQSSPDNSAVENRTEELKKQLEAAAMLIERRDATIQELNEKISTMTGELSYAHMSESENRLKIKQLTADLENERQAAKQLADKLAAMPDTTDNTPQPTKASGRKPGRPPKNTKPEPQAETQAATIEEPVIQDSETAKPEPELEEAVKHVFKISFDDDANAENSDDATMTYATMQHDEHETHDLLQPELPIADTTAIDNRQSYNDVIDNPVEPPAATDLLSDEQNIDSTFETSGNDLPVLDDDIEWLMPTAQEDETDNDKSREDDAQATENADNDKTNESPVQQQMSLF